MDDAQRIAQLIVQRLEEGAIEGKAGLEEIAGQFELSSRQIRRIVQKELGVPPIQLLLTRRLLLAKQLLTETALPVTEIAFASGFSSLRRFNDAFNARYRMAPTRLRKKATEGAAAIADSTTSTLQLSYRPPYDWNGVLAFLSARALTGIEWVTSEGYARTVTLGDARGWIRVTHAPRKRALMLEFTHTLTPALPALLCRVRALFDLDARPDMIAKHLARDARLARAVKGNPGLRVPGAFSGFEMGLRAILGQQVTVKAATTIACRFVEAFGDPIVDALSGAPPADAIAGTRRASRASTTSPGSASFPREPGASSRWQRRSSRARSASKAAAITIPTSPSDNSPGCPGSVRGRRNTSRCAPCDGPTRFRRRTSPCATTWVGSALAKRNCCHRPGGHGAAMP